jgi:hypothetical protein
MHPRWQPRRRPMALRLQDADDMMCAHDEGGRQPVRRQAEPHQRSGQAREALEAGCFGKLVLGTHACAGAATSRTNARRRAVPNAHPQQSRVLSLPMLARSRRNGRKT